MNPEGIGPLVLAMMDGKMWQISLSSGCFFDLVNTTSDLPRSGFVVRFQLYE